MTDRITKLIIRHQPSGRTEEHVVDGQTWLTAYEVAGKNCIQLPADQIIASVQLLPTLGELFIQVWDRGTWISLNERRMRQEVAK